MTNPIPDLDLRKFGYAPGRYMGKCLSCGEEQWDLDKRSTSCRPCAIKRYEQSLTEPPTPTPDLDRAIREAVEARWLPIESAPKDGSKFLAYEMDEYFDCWWHDNGYGEQYWMDWADSEPNPTHWMPLPDPPAAVRKDQP